MELDARADDLVRTYSGGMRRRLELAQALVHEPAVLFLDEPTIGLDVAARQKIWEHIRALKGRGMTIFVTTHYMDEADVLGDRVGIMSLGALQCIGSTQFLKKTFGAGYKLVFDKNSSHSAKSLENLTAFVESNIPGASYISEDGEEEQAIYNLPFDSISKFGDFFALVEKSLDKFEVSNFGVSITSLEDVFLKVGEDHSVKPTGKGIGSGGTFTSSFTSQVIGIAARKLTYASNDFVTIPLLGLPSVVSIIAAVLYKNQFITSDDSLNDLIVTAMYIGGYLCIPGLLAEFIVKERNDKLRNVLTVMGCDYRAYWLGTFIADFILMTVPLVVTWTSWRAGGMTDFYSKQRGLCFFISLLFTGQVIAFSYLFSFVFENPKSCIAIMPIVVILLILAPVIMLLIVVLIFTVGAKLFSVSQPTQVGIYLWGTMITTPHGAMYNAYLTISADLGSSIKGNPPIGATIIFMFLEAVLFLYFTLYTDSLSSAKLDAQTDPSFDASILDNLDEDVKAERTATEAASTLSTPLKVDRLRKVFAPKAAGKSGVVATEDICFTVQDGEIFGLLGANGAGKTTTLSMLTRHLVPTSGNAYISGYSILNQFNEGATNLGVVTQTNSLWDRLSVQDHLFLFARLRGVPEDKVKQVVDGTIDQLELTPHRTKLAMRLSGGMKRKLCVAIALIGDPKVVLLDEPSAGLDPVSRRNLWTVILRTMSHRAVVLTTHSMEEAEALCERIGIMVKGQLRALGTKQHLKSKFGSGYELVMKVRALPISRGMKNVDEMAEAANVLEMIERVCHFVTGMFSESVLISNNGGLLTFRIPRTQMKIGLIFGSIEANKERLCIEDYSIAQPTLEQVFIHIVAGSDPTLDTTRQSVVLDEFGNVMRDSKSANPLANLVDNRGDNVVAMEFVEEKNKCGCTNKQINILLGLSIFFFIMFMAIAFGAKVGALFSIGIVFFVIAIIACSIKCCPCCKQPKGEDE
jgi:ABC-type multidrug transport system ATPase subunit